MSKFLDFTPYIFAFSYAGARKHTLRPNFFSWKVRRKTDIWSTESFLYLLYSELQKRSNLSTKKWKILYIIFTCTSGVYKKCHNFFSSHFFAWNSQRLCRRCL